MFSSVGDVRVGQSIITEAVHTNPVSSVCSQSPCMYVCVRACARACVGGSGAVATRARKSWQLIVVARTGVSIVGPDRSAAAAFFCRGEHRSDSTAGPLPPPGLRAGGICVDGYAVAVRQNLIAQIWRVLECS